MINPLRLTEKQVIIISIITVVVGLAAMLSLYSYAAGTDGQYDSNFLPKGPTKGE